MDDQQGDLIDGTRRAPQWDRSPQVVPPPVTENGKGGRVDAPKSIAGSLLIPARLLETDAPSLPPIASITTAPTKVANDTNSEVSDSTATTDTPANSGIRQPNPFLVAEAGRRVDTRRRVRWGDRRVSHRIGGWSAVAVVPLVLIALVLLESSGPSSSKRLAGVHGTSGSQAGLSGAFAPLAHGLSFTSIVNSLRSVNRILAAAQTHPKRRSRQRTHRAHRHGSPSTRRRAQKSHASAQSQPANVPSASAATSVATTTTPAETSPPVSAPVTHTSGSSSTTGSGGGSSSSTGGSGGGSSGSAARSGSGAQRQPAFGANGALAPGHVGK